MTWLTETADGVLLRIQAQPKASRSEVSGVHGDRLKIRIAAPPVDGEANEELIRFFEEETGHPLFPAHARARPELEDERCALRGNESGSDRREIAHDHLTKFFTTYSRASCLLLSLCSSARSSITRRILENSGPGL